MKILLLSLWAASLALGSLAPRSTNDAATICQSMSFESSKTSCAKEILTGYFDAGACGVCRSMSYDSSKLQCVTTIKNNEYQTGVVKICLGTSFDSTKNECLKNLGKPIDPNKKRLVRCLNELSRNRAWTYVYDETQQFCEALGLNPEMLEADWKFGSCWTSSTPESRDHELLHDTYYHCLVEYRCVRR